MATPKKADVIGHYTEMHGYNAVHTPPSFAHVSTGELLDDHLAIHSHGPKVFDGSGVPHAHATRNPLQWHRIEAQRHLDEAREMRVEHHSAVDQALGTGSPDAFAGSHDNERNDMETSELPGRESRVQAWKNTIRDFREDPTTS